MGCRSDDEKAVRYVRISHTIRPGRMPAGLKGEPPVVITPVMRLDEGAESNCSRVTLFNHCGTHVDAPAHFVAGGRTVADLEIEELIFDRPVIVEVPLSDEELVTRRHLEEQSAALADCDLLLIRSGFSAYRSIDLERYTWSTPGVSAEAASYIVEEFANVNAVGVDFLSFETLRDMSHGFPAHRIVLGKDVLIIEDLNLAGIQGGRLRRVLAFPLFIEGVDSFHATVVAELSADR